MTRHKRNQNSLEITSQGQTPNRGLKPTAIFGSSLRDYITATLLSEMLYRTEKAKNQNLEKKLLSACDICAELPHTRAAAAWAGKLFAPQSSSAPGRIQSSPPTAGCCWVRQ